MPTVLLHYLHYSVLFRPGPAVRRGDGAGHGRRAADPDRPRRATAGCSTRGSPPSCRPAARSTPTTTSTAGTWCGGRRRSGATTDDGGPAGQRRHLLLHERRTSGRRVQPGQGSCGSGLEDYLQEHADTFDRKLAVFAGPVLDPRDPPYRGHPGAAAVLEGRRPSSRTAPWRPPATCSTSRRWSTTSAPRSTRPRPPAEPPPLGAFRTFQVPIADIAALTGVVLDQLVARRPAAGAAARTRRPPPGQAAGGWVQLDSLDDVRLTHWTGK